MKLRLTVDGKIYEVNVEVLEQDQRQGLSLASGHLSAPAHAAAAQIQPAAQPPSASTSPVDEEKVFRSPISGVVVKVPVEIGQAVQVNEVLIVLEAMKMETVVASQFAGKISNINVQIGDSVQVGQVLVEFE